MPTTLAWNGNTIEIATTFRRRYGFIATGTRVKVNGREVAESGGFRFVELAHGTFRDAKLNAHLIDVRSSVLFTSASSQGYVLSIDNREVSRGKNRIDNLGAGVLASLGGLALLGGAVAGALALFG